MCEITGASGSGTCGQTTSQTGYRTKYTRNSAGNITGVTQNAQGTPTEARSFAFDELGRMTSETNPESGTTTYTFDSSSTCGAGATSAGDLAERVDANGNVTCYAHDALHRVTAITYPSGPNASATPAKSFVYGDTVSGGVTVDGVAMLNAKGRLAEAYTGTSTAKITDLGFNYPSADEETVYQTSAHSGGWYTTSATRFPNGSPETLSVPGVPEITYGADGEGRPSTVSAASGQSPVTAASYTALGLTAATLGSNDTDGYTYDTTTGRMTQYQFTVNGKTDTGALTWNANGSLNQLQITDNISGTSDTQTCTYTHDDLARIASVSCGGWSQTFGYDPFGNLSKSGTQSFSATYTNNRISGNTNYTVTYDSDGNLEDDPITGNPNSFDAEGKAVKLENVAVTFDALGRAVEAAESGGTIEFLYGPGGSKLAVMSGQTLKRADIPLPTGGEAVYTSSGLAYYRHADHLGSSRLASTSSRTLYSSTAYAPYGEAYDQAGTADKSFTGQKQDINSTASGGQYDFLMREQNPIQGRWWTPDPAGFAAVNPANPQSWNRYAYVDNQPEEMIDEDGLCPQGSHEATAADMAAAIQVAESYVGNAQYSSGTHWQAGSPPGIDCSGLMMCALSGTAYSPSLAFPSSYLGMNLTTSNIDQWTDPGTGAVGDIVYFANPGHVGIVTGPNTFLSSQSHYGPSFAQFGPEANYWGNPAHTSAPVFRRACVADPATGSSGGGGGGGGAGGGGGGGADPGSFGLWWVEWMWEQLNPIGWSTSKITYLPSQ